MDRTLRGSWGWPSSVGVDEPLADVSELVLLPQEPTRGRLGMSALRSLRVGRSRHLDRAGKGLDSDGVLRVLTTGLDNLGYRAELSKAAVQKIARPVLFGPQGRPPVDAKR